MTTPRRIYRLIVAGKVRLIKATSQAQAIAHVVRGQNIIVTVASQDDLVEGFAAGVTVEDSRVEAEAES